MNIGILGLGKISKRVANGIIHAKDGVLYGVASRNIEKAEAFQKECHAIKAYGSYEDLCLDDAIELIYICTPNHLHKEHIMLCLKHHKHVTCEKPMLTNREDLKECFDYAKQQHCFLMEAHKTLFTPLNQKLIQMVREGVIGKLSMIDARYCSYLNVHEKDLSSWVLRGDVGGCLYDIGVYPIAYANYFAQSKLKHHDMMIRRKKEGYISQAQGMLMYENGVMAHIVCSWDASMENKGFLYGDEGYIVCENFWKNTRAYLIKNGEKTEISVQMESDFTGEVEHAISCIHQGLLESPVLPYAGSDEILKVIEEKRECD